MKELNINPDTLTQEAKDYVNTYVADAAKVADIVVRDRLEKMLPQELNGLKQQISLAYRLVVYNSASDKGPSSSLSQILSKFGVYSTCRDDCADRTGQIDAHRSFKIASCFRNQAVASIEGSFATSCGCFVFSRHFYRIG